MSWMNSIRKANIDNKVFSIFSVESDKIIIFG